MQAGGSAFSVLFKGAGSSAVDDIIPSLLSGLDGTERQSEQACHTFSHASVRVCVRVLKVGAWMQTLLHSLLAHPDHALSRHTQQMTRQGRQEAYSN